MAYTPKRYRRLADGHIFNAVQHTMSGDVQVVNVVNQIGAFILGTDVDTNVGIHNERMLDIIKPIEREWAPKRGLATIEVIDPNSGAKHQVRLGDWIVKHSDQRGDFLLFIKPAVFDISFAEVTVFEELSDLIYQSLPEHAPSHQAASEKVASAILGAGWKKGTK